MKDLINKLKTVWYIIKYQYVFRRATFGPNTLIKCKLAIKGPGKITIGSNCCIESDPWGDDYVTLYTHQPEAKIEIGNHVMLRATRFGSHVSISIGNNSIVEYSSIFDSDFHNLDATKRDEDFHQGDRSVEIGEGCYVGCECLCSKGTMLGKNVTLFPGTVIGTKRIPDDCCVGGNPARIIRRKVES